MYAHTALFPPLPHHVVRNCASPFCKRPEDADLYFSPCARPATLISHPVMTSAKCAPQNTPLTTSNRARLQTQAPGGACLNASKMMASRGSDPPMHACMHACSLHSQTLPLHAAHSIPAAQLQSVSQDKSRNCQSKGQKKKRQAAQHMIWACRPPHPSHAMLSHLTTA